MADYAAQKARRQALREQWATDPALQEKRAEIEQKVLQAPSPPPAAQSFRNGGMVKAGSPRLSAPCRDSKTVKC